MQTSLPLNQEGVRSVTPRARRLSQRTRHTISAAVVGGSLALAACGNASSTVGTDEELRVVTVVRPNPSVVNLFNLCAAVGEGYFEEEGLSIRLEAVDGVSAVLQAMVAGQAEIGVPAAGPVLLARQLAGGPAEAPVMFYNHFAQSTYGLVVSDESGFDEPRDLAGLVIGVGTADGAEVFFAKSILMEAGLNEGVDYELLAVGDGGPALAAFERGDISAYSAAVPDMATLSARGFPIKEITPKAHLNYFGIGFAATEEFMGANPDVIEGFTRALIRGTEFSLANKNRSLEHCAELNPEEGANREVTDPLFDVVADRISSVDGTAWGIYPDGSWEAWQDVLIATGELDEPVEDLDDAYTNEFVESVYENR